MDAFYTTSELKTDGWIYAVGEISRHDNSLACDMVNTHHT